MATSFVGFEGLTAGTDDPIGMLAACHGRVRKQCATLRALIPHLTISGADDEAAAAAHRVMRYFDEAAVHHHADEERDLFPRLQEAAPDETSKTEVRILCVRLGAEHERLGDLWQQVRSYLIKVRSHQLPDLKSMQALVDHLIQGYEQHTAFEDETLLPLATKLLGAAALESIGQSMKARRQQPSH